MGNGERTVYLHPGGVERCQWQLVMVANSSSVAIFRRRAARLPDAESINGFGRGCVAGFDGMER